MPARLPPSGGRRRVREAVALPGGQCARDVGRPEKTWPAGLIAILVTCIVVPVGMLDSDERLYQEQDAKGGAGRRRGARHSAAAVSS